MGPKVTASCAVGRKQMHLLPYSRSRRGTQPRGKSPGGKQPARIPGDCSRPSASKAGALFVLSLLRIMAADYCCESVKLFRRGRKRKIAGNLSSVRLLLLVWWQLLTASAGHLQIETILHARDNAPATKLL